MRHNDDCSLELSEAIDLLLLVHYAFEHADNPTDWFAVRQCVGTGIYAAEKAIRHALRIVEGPPRPAAAPEARPH